MRQFRFMFHQKVMACSLILRDILMSMQVLVFVKTVRILHRKKIVTQIRSWSSRPYSDAVEILVPAAGVEVYVFAGPTTLDAVRRFNLFNGGGPLPPRWGLGFTQRVRSLFTADEVKAEADSFKLKGYPLDFIGLEPGWQSKSYPGTFEWDKKRYPEPEKFVKEMMDRNIRLNLWINPYVSKASFFL